MAHLKLDQKLIQKCRKLAKEIADPIEELIQTHTTVSIERSVLRLIGIEDALREPGGQYYPLVNIIVEDLKKQSVLSRGVLYWFVNGLIATQLQPQELALAVAQKKNLSYWVTASTT